MSARCTQGVRAKPANGVPREPEQDSRPERFATAKGCNYAVGALHAQGPLAQLVELRTFNP